MKNLNIHFYIYVNIFHQLLHKCKPIKLWNKIVIIINHHYDNNKKYTLNEDFLIEHKSTVFMECTGC